MTDTPPNDGANGDRYTRMLAVAEKLSRFKNKPLIKLPVLVELVTKMDLLRHVGRLQPAGAERDGMCISLAPGIGKSTAARMMVAKAAQRAGRTVSDGPVLLVTLDVEETISLWNSILRELGDPYWDTGYPKSLKKRALKLLARRGVELIIVDEFNHSVDRGQARLLMNVVKEILNEGIANVVAMGSDEEVEQLPKSDAFQRRMVHAPSIGPLLWGDAENERNWRGFLQGLDQAITSRGILELKSGLGAVRLAKALNEACGGIIGYAHWVVNDALTDVLERGGRSIEPADLAISVGRLFQKHAIYDRINAVEGL